MEPRKETVMVVTCKLKLNCPCSYNKIKNLLCSFPQIRDQAYSEEHNAVAIKVMCCCPEKIKDWLYCKGGKYIKSIEIIDPTKPSPIIDSIKLLPPPPPTETQETPNSPAKKPPQVLPPAKPTCCSDCCHGGSTVPCCKEPRPVCPTKKCCSDCCHEKPGRVCPQNTCCSCSDCCRRRDPCCQGCGGCEALPLPPPLPPPGCCYHTYADYHTYEQNPTTCVIM